MVRIRGVPVSARGRGARGGRGGTSTRGGKNTSSPGASTSKDGVDHLIPVMRGRRRGRPPLRSNVLARKFPHQVYWSVEEKHLMLKGLKEVGPNKPEIIKQRLPNKTLQDVKDFMYKAHNKAKISPPVSLESKVPSSAPIEVWLDLAEALTEDHNESVDYSWTLSKVLSMIKTLEYHDPSQTPNMPNYDKIYSYMEALLEHKPMAALPRLSLIEAGVMLDVLQNLAETLKTMQTCDQISLLKWKRSLLEVAKHHTDDDGKFRGWRALLERFPESEDLRNAIESAKRNKMLGRPSDYGNSNADSNPTEEDGAEETNNVSSAGLQQQRPPEKIVIEGVEIDVNQANDQGSPLFTINPFVIPVHYLKPDYKAVAPITKMDEAVLNTMLHRQSKNTGQPGQYVHGQGFISNRQALLATTTPGEGDVKIKSQPTSSNQN